MLPSNAGIRRRSTNTRFSPLPFRSPPRRRRRLCRLGKGERGGDENRAMSNGRTMKPCSRMGLEQVRERAGRSVPDVLVATCGAEIGRPKVSQVWSAPIRHSERSASTKGPCLPRFRLQMVWKDSMKEKGGNPPSTLRSRQRLPDSFQHVAPLRTMATVLWSRRLLGNARPRGGGANRSATVSGFARQETTPPPAAGEDVIFHFPAHATSPTGKREKKGRQPLLLLVPSSNFYSSVALPGANDSQRASSSTARDMRGQAAQSSSRSRAPAASELHVRANM